MRSSFLIEDVEILLKDISGMIEPLPETIREKNIQNGTHYSEMLPLEYVPTENYMRAYQNALENYSVVTAKAICVLAEKLYCKKGESIVIVSLARAGIPIGILIRRYLNNKYKINVKHYAISIIRGRGIDKNAMNFILKRHDKESIQFVDGWIGKGAILNQLKEALADYSGIDTELAVVSDPANVTELCGTHDDFLIPSSCLNATVTGLISRTVLNTDIIEKNDYHGAVYYENLEKDDLTESFLEKIEKYFDYDCTSNELENSPKTINGIEVVLSIAKRYEIKDINLIKPGIGETTRVLLRRIPWKILVNNKYSESPELEHIFQLAKEKNIICEISEIDMGNYKVCGIIKNLSDM